MNTSLRSIGEARDKQQGFSVAAGWKDSDETLMIPRPPREFGSHTDTVHLGTPPGESWG